MKAFAWRRDTIARRFILTEVLAVGIALLLLSLFNVFGGVWSQEPLDKSALFREVSEALDMIEAAPPQVRPALAASISTRVVGLNWYAAPSEVSAFLEATGKSPQSDFVKRVIATTHHPALTIDPDSPLTVPPSLLYDRDKSGLPYMLALQLTDRSWIVYTAPVRFWGVSASGMWIIRIVCFALSIVLVTAVAARQFARPIEQLAAAVRQFGLDPNAPPIAETGPRELRQVIATFNAMQARIQTFIAHRTTMLAAISHDLRTPLTRIRLRGELIDDREQQARLFRDVDEMQAMVDGALAFFRDDAVAEAATLFDLADMISTIVNDYADQGVTIAYDGPDRAIYQGRPFSLKRVLTNLADNAIKYGTAPEIALSHENSAWVIAVADRGPGIPEDSLHSVFRPYHRLDKSRNRMTGGVGLGLTVAQAIVQGHGGEIVLRNRPGGGLIAVITLPVAAAISGERAGAAF